MAANEHKSKRVCITISAQDHARLTRLAQESLRTRSGYLRWLLHRHFEVLDKAGK